MATPEPPKPPATPPPGTPGTPADGRPASERPPLRPMKRNGRRWRANLKRSPKTSDLDRNFRRRAG